MKRAYSIREIKEADANTIAGGVPSYTLVERAGKALAEAVENAVCAYGDAVFVCGGGNNGADGFVAAELIRKQGIEADVICFASSFSPDCARARAAYQGDIMRLLPRKRYGVAVDCLFGTGLSRPIEGDYAALVHFINSARYVISADVPSGLQENGIAGSVCVKARETVTFGANKCCLLLADGADFSGRVTVADIGIFPLATGAELWEDSDAIAYFPKRKRNVNKATFGSVSILAGSVYSGAPLLSAMAALRSGAGYVKLYAREPLYESLIARLPDCILKRFTEADEELFKSDCIAIGMGYGTGEELYSLLTVLLKEYRGTLVIDADGLNALARYGKEVLKEAKCSVILTPHPKEFSRLTGLSVPQILMDAVEQAKEFARTYGVVVALKNNRTVLTDGERVALNLTGSPALAKGGSGDVLCGFLAGTCARGVPAFEASCVSSYLIGRAGELAAARFGEYSAAPSDVANLLPDSIISLKKL